MVAALQSRPRAEDRSQRGLAVVELALLLPLLMLVLFGVIEYGWMFLKNQQIADAARTGARVAVTEGATNALVTARVEQALATSNLGSSGYVLILVPSDISTAPPGSTVRVEILVPYANIALTGVPIVPVPDGLASQTSMVKEGTP